ncbi:MAG TPA: hypothetical protein DCM40_00045 [Maribacter sp.]|nr:hypothetical protein [Maribacter sp.]
MKFLNKKEQVFDIQLTPHGKYKLSAGASNPVYYAFFDDNVIYDIEYVSGSSAEVQNEIHERIKNETQYLESQAIFQERMGESVVEGGLLLDTIYPQEENLLTSYGSIGDARLLSEETNVAPAWKVAAMVGTITGSIKNSFQGELGTTTTDVQRSEANVTQINITASYTLSSEDPTELNRNNSYENFRDLEFVTSTFADGRVIKLTTEDPLIYLEELNTELLTKNFDIEVFKIEDDDFRKLYFKSQKPQIVDGMMVTERPEIQQAELDKNSVEYYFSILRDAQVDDRLVCKHIQQFNTENYLIDLDYDCTDAAGQDVYFDIYGKVTESEICPD